MCVLSTILFHISAPVVAAIVLIHLLTRQNGRLPMMVRLSVYIRLLAIGICHVVHITLSHVV